MTSSEEETKRLFAYTLTVKVFFLLSFISHVMENKILRFVLQYAKLFCSFYRSVTRKHYIEVASTSSSDKLKLNVDTTCHQTVLVHITYHVIS